MRAFPLILYFCGLILIFLFGNHLSDVNENVYYHYVNAALFLASIFSAFFLTFTYFKDAISFLSKESNLFLFSSVILFSVWICFFFLGDQINGRYLNYSLILSDNFDQFVSLTDYVSDLEGRTYQQVFFDFFQYFTGIGINPELLIAINRCFGVGLLISVFLLAREVLKDNWISLLTILVFSSSKYAQFVMSSFEYGTPAVFFFTLSLFFLIRFLENQSNKDQIFAVLLFLVASFFRYEILLLGGVPFFTIMALNSDRTRLKTSLIYSFAVLLIFRSIPFTSHVVSGEDVYLHGKNLEPGFFSLLTNTWNVITHNIQQGDLNFLRGAISFFTYAFFIIISINVWKFIKTKKANHSILSLGAIGVTYFLGTFLFHIEGMRSGEKYSIFYFACEIIVTFSFILTVISDRKIARVICGGFFIVSFFFNPLLSFRLQPVVAQIEAKEYEDLKKIKMDESCYFIRLQQHQPIVIYLFPLKFRTIYLEDFEDFDQGQKCFYYLDQRYIEYSNNSNLIKKDILEIKNIFPKCETSIELNADLYSLYKFQC